MKFLILLSFLVSGTLFASDETENGHSIIYQEEIENDREI